MVARKQSAKPEPMTFTAAMRDYFDHADLHTELKQLTPGDRIYYAKELNRLGYRLTDTVVD